MAAMRRLAPELLVTAKTQRWTPEEFLRTLVEAEIAARDASNARTRLRAAAFPVTKTLAEFDVTASSVPAATFDYLASLEWIRAAENLCLIGPAGTGKSHILVALGLAAVEAGHRVRYFTAAELVETLYRGLADNSVGRVIDTLLRNDLVIVDELGFAPLDDTGAQLLFRFVAAAYERRALGDRLALALRVLGPVPARAHHRRQPCSTGCCTTATSSSPTASRYRMREARAEGGNRDQEDLNNPEGWGLLLATSGDHELAVDSRAERSLSTWVRQVSREIAEAPPMGRWAC